MDNIYLFSLKINLTICRNIDFFEIPKYPSVDLAKTRIFIFSVRSNGGSVNTDFFFRLLKFYLKI